MRHNANHDAHLRSPHPFVVDVDSLCFTRTVRPRDGAVGSEACALTIRGLSKSFGDPNERAHPYIVAATAMLQAFRFPQPSGLKVVEISRLFPLTNSVSVNK